LQLAINS